MVKKITIKDIKKLFHEEEKWFPKELDQETINYIRKKNYKVNKNKSEKIVNLVPFLFKKKFIPTAIAASLLIFFINKVAHFNESELLKYMKNASIGKEFTIGIYNYKLEKEFSDTNGNSCYVALSKYNMDLSAYRTTKKELNQLKNIPKNVNICKINGRWEIK